MSRADDLSLRPFGAPKYWPVWFLLGVLRLAALLPFSMQIRLGSALGRLLHLIERRRRRIVHRNLEICFPELSESERADLLRRHFRSVGISMFEMAIGWFSSTAKLERLVEIRGLDNLQNALADGKGALLVGAHFTPVEVCVAVLESVDIPFATMYRTQRNAMMDVLIRRGRHRFAADQIPRNDARTLIRRLRSDYAVIYFPDQTYLGNQSALIPFFGEPALTNLATSKIAKISGAPVLTIFCRNADDSGYTVDIGPVLDRFPSDDPVADTRRIVTLLEDYIRGSPDQYLWLYKKFKRRPESLPDLYT
jgi:KDO2-lipid IV(A) lauroyltransferase